MGRPRSGDGPRRDCRHTTVQHEHGTHAAYVRDDCRCRDCRDAVADRSVHVRKQTAYGRWRPFVDPEPARQHVDLLRSSGLGLARIARVAGLSYNTLSKLVHAGPNASTRIRPRTERAILAVTPNLDRLAGSARVEATGTRRRLQALVWLGYSQARLEAELGLRQGGLSKMLTRDQVHVSTARDVRVLYDRLWNSPPAAGTGQQRKSVTRARNHARRRGWAPPLAWDNIDDPAERPKR